MARYCVCDGCGEFLTVGPHSLFRYGPAGTERDHEFAFYEECVPNIVKEYGRLPSSGDEGPTV